MLKKFVAYCLLRFHGNRVVEEFHNSNETKLIFFFSPRSKYLLTYVVYFLHKRTTYLLIFQNYTKYPTWFPRKDVRWKQIAISSSFVDKIINKLYLYLISRRILIALSICWSAVRCTKLVYLDRFIYEIAVLCHVA